MTQEICKCYCGEKVYRDDGKIEGKIHIHIGEGSHTIFLRGLNRLYENKILSEQDTSRIKEMLIKHPSRKNHIGYAIAFSPDSLNKNHKFLSGIFRTLRGYLPAIGSSYSTIPSPYKKDMLKVLQILGKCIITFKKYHLVKEDA